MIFLTIFLSLISSSLLYNKFYFIALIFIIFALVILSFKRLKKLFIIFLLTFVISFLFIYLKESLNLLNTSYFIVLERKESYLICFNGFKSFYLDIDENLLFDNFDIIKINDSKFVNLDFQTLESGFDFKSYLFSKSVDQEISFSKIEEVFDFPLSFYFLKVNFLNKFSDPIYRNFISGFLFSSLDYSLKETHLLKELQLITLFSLTGIYLNFVLYGLKKIFEFKFNEKESYILAFITFSPFLLINISRFTTIKVIIFFIFNFINKCYLNKKYSRIEVISIVGSFFILISSRIIYQAGFYMSFLIYFFLHLTASKFCELKYFEKKIAIQLLLGFVILPFNISFNNSLNLLSFLFIMLFLPFSKILFIISILTFLFLPSFIIEGIFGIIYRIIYAFDSLKISIFLPPLNEFLIIIYYLLLIFFFYFYEINYKKRYILVGSILTLLLLTYSLPIDNFLSYQVSFINVGQGDSTLIRYKNKNYLIDTGGLTYTDLANNNLIPFFKKNRIYELEAVFITHHDFDHYGALESLKENFKINNIYDYNNFNQFKTKESSLDISNLNNFIDLWSDENNRSLVLYLNIKENAFLFMGDASKDIEKRIIEEYQNLDVDYLKVSHHGSKTASSLEFLKEIKPVEAIISCGKNNWYNHPNEEVISNLNKLNIKIRRTDLEGTITYKFY